jgi:hypothetical protein
MSLHASLVMVQADARSAMGSVFELFHYHPLGMEAVQTWEAALEAIRYPRSGSPRTTVHKAVATCNGWTVVVDPELAMAADAAACGQLAARFGAPAFAMTCEGASSTYGFSSYRAGVRRAFMAVDGDVAEDEGPPIPQEAGIDLGKLLEDDVLRIMDRVGVPYSGLESAGSFDIWALDESHLPTPQPSGPAAQAAPSKPWWKVW